MNPNHRNCHQHHLAARHGAARGSAQGPAPARPRRRHRATVNQGVRRSTPLGLAARWGHRTMVALLLDRGADPNASGAPWATPLEWARKKGHAASPTATVSNTRSRARFTNATSRPKPPRIASQLESRESGASTATPASSAAEPSRRSTPWPVPPAPWNRTTSGSEPPVTFGGSRRIASRGRSSPSPRSPVADVVTPARGRAGAFPRARQAFRSRFGRRRRPPTTRARPGQRSKSAPGDVTGSVEHVRHQSTLRAHRSGECRTAAAGNRDRRPTRDVEIEIELREQQALQLISCLMPISEV